MTDLTWPVHPFATFRYAINDTDGDWSSAHAQVSALADGSKAGRNLSSVVSVKGSAPVAPVATGGGDKKRKAEESGGDRKKGKKTSGGGSGGGVKKGGKK